MFVIQEALGTRLEGEFHCFMINASDAVSEP